MSWRFYPRFAQLFCSIAAPLAKESGGLWFGFCPNGQFFPARPNRAARFTPESDKRISVARAISPTTMPARLILPLAANLLFSGRVFFRQGCPIPV